MDVHGTPSKGFPTVSLDTEDDNEDWNVPDTSWDEEITRKLFSDLNCDLLGLPSDGLVIVISDSEEKEHGDDHANVDDALSFLRVPPAPSVSATDDDGTPDRVQDDSSGSGTEDEARTP
jgi:hypothetical protein